MRQHELTARSIALSTWVSRRWTIEDVLDAYGSDLWMGADRYGLEAGAHHYWGRTLEELEPHEVATLLAVGWASFNACDPACRPERALALRGLVLQRMRDGGAIDEGAFRRAMDAPLRVQVQCDRPIILK